jgi:hypothetical protein
MAITFINSVNNYCKFKNLARENFVNFQMVLVFGDICKVKAYTSAKLGNDDELTTAYTTHCASDER